MSIRRHGSTVSPRQRARRCSSLRVRTDIVADHPCGTYIFELKVNKPPKVAMSQVQRKKYAAPYRAAGKPVWAVGLSFNGRTRQFKAGVAERVKLKA